ncbi:heme NO-binding domain-containing protein [Actibacterium sp. MT2.3-13A]|uniref:heme NO-binding domain-containing protein n=1 Tax=Actibacterium sp. MT2.3-13A TaxID=2828332 RepID=UPI001BADE739|nr:heme NO-binding domain-containing protein [Actibacterium sp. MT2.3-13A]
MHGLINRSIQAFVQETCGQEAWLAVAAQAGIGPEGFEPLLPYDDALTEAMLAAIARLRDRPREAVLEEIGGFLVVHPRFGMLRRLLRFGGETFVDFLRSLDEVEGRMRIVLPELESPRLELRQIGDNAFRLTCCWCLPGGCHVVSGALRAMAEDYGARVLVEPLGEQEDGASVLEIEVLKGRAAGGRNFKLAAP